MAEKQKTKSEQAIAAIATFLGDNAGLHDLEAIKSATGIDGRLAGRVLADLVRSGAVVLDQTEEVNRWALPPLGGEIDTTASVQANAQNTDAAGGTTAGANDEKDGAAGTGAAEPEAESDAVVEAEIDEEVKDHTESTTGTGPVKPLDPDPMVMLIAHIMAEGPTALSTREVAEAAYMPLGSREVLTALRALAEHNLITCTKPFAPDDEDCQWQCQEGLSYGELMPLARAVAISDAPDAVTCPTCGTVKAIAGVSKRRKRGGDLRADGTRKLPPGGLKRLVKVWLERTENAGEEITPGQLTRELRAEHGDQISKHAYGAVSQSMEKFTEEDPAESDKRPLLVLVNDSPVTYRIRSAE